MQKVVLCVVALFLLTGFVAAGQLPPSIEVDRRLLTAERQTQEGDFAGAVATLDEVVALSERHGLTIPEEFWFLHARAALESGATDDARESATRYLNTAGRAGEHYLAVLELLDDITLRTQQAEARQQQLAARQQQLAAVLEQIWRQLAVLQGRGNRRVSGRYEGPRFRMWHGGLGTESFPVEMETRASLSFSRDCRLQASAWRYAESQEMEIRGGNPNYSRDEEEYLYQVDVRVSDVPIIGVRGYSNSRYKNIRYGFVSVSFDRAVVERSDIDGNSSMTSTMSIPVWVDNRDGRAVQEAEETFQLMQEFCATPR